MDRTNPGKEKLLQAMVDYVEGPDGHNGLSRLLAQPMSEKERVDLLHEAINILNEMTAFVQMMLAKKTE
jgi:hypothetical protein